ncbi:hypothetical protein D3C81_1497820 [compost metagenome]
MQPTLRRTSLCGTAYKRLAWIEVLANDKSAEHKALAKMEEFFTEAERRAKLTDPARAYEPALERLAAQMFIAAPASVKTDILQVQAQLRPWVESQPDFQNVAALILANLYLVLLDAELKVNSTELLNSFADLKRRVPAVLKWREVQMQVDFVLDRYMANASKAESLAVKAFKENMTDWVKAQD